MIQTNTSTKAAQYYDQLKNSYDVNLLFGSFQQFNTLVSVFGLEAMKEEYPIYEDESRPLWFVELQYREQGILPIEC